MELLENKILTEGRILQGNILKVDNFLNHQLDIKLFNELGKEFKKRFAGKEVTKILTAEVSGIAIAAIVAQYFDVPVLFAKKYSGGNMDKETYETEIFSYTKRLPYKIRVAKRYLSSEDKILIIDDFLASGSALVGLIDIARQSGAEIVGAGVVIEKGFQGGREKVEDLNVKLESLAIIESMDEGSINFKH